MIERSPNGFSGVEPPPASDEMLEVFVEGDEPQIEIDDTLPEPRHLDNLAEFLSDTDLASIASDLIAQLDADRQSREVWERTYKEGLDLVGLKFEDRVRPWPGACGVFHPMLAEGIIRFQAQSITEMFPAAGPAKCKILGKADDARRAQAARVQDEFNYWLTEKMPEYRDETEQLLFAVPMTGSAFRKVYIDPILKRPTAIFVPAEDFILPYGYSRLETCPRYTHIISRDTNDVKKLQQAGFYKRMDLSESVQSGDEIDEKKGELTGQARPADSAAKPPRKLFEMHVNLDLPAPFADIAVNQDTGQIENTGIALPYVVTIDEESKKILAVYRNWEEQDPDKRKRLHFVHYRYVPGLEAYGFGLIHLIGGATKAATSILRQLVDAGTLSNLPGGYKSKDLRIKNDDDPHQPAEWRDVDTGGGALRESFFPLPYKEPSAVLFQLMTTMVAEARRFASTQDIQVGEGNQEAPVGTTVALLERAMKVMTAIQARLHESQRQEFRLLMPLIRYAKEVYEFEPSVGGRDSKAADFDDRVDVIPVSDPNAASMAMRVTQLQAALQLSAQNPSIYDMPKLHRQMLEAIGVQGAAELVPDKGAGKLADPLAENIAMLTSKPTKVFPHQDHDAHMEVHLSLLNDPKTIQVFNQSALGNQMKAGIDAHIAEHLAFAHRDKVERQIGTQIPLPGEPMTPEVERMVSTLMAEGSRKALAQSKAAVEAQQAQQAANDPVVQMQQAELQINAQKAQSAAATAAGKLQLARKQHDDKMALESARLAQQERMANEAIESREDIAEAERVADFALEAMKPPPSPPNFDGGQQ